MKACAYQIPFECGSVHIGETGRNLKTGEKKITKIAVSMLNRKNQLLLGMCWSRTTLSNRKNLHYSPQTTTVFCTTN